MIDLPSWLSPENKILLALSGGRDSVCLLHLLHKLGFEKIVPCHLNHQLRGADSESDEIFVRELCDELQLTCEISRIDVASEAEKTKKSLETAARDCRRQFFAECAIKHEASELLLAHHAEDQAETILFNLLRGSAGLKGMDACSSQTIDGISLTFLRPLLTIRRAEIDDFLSHHRIPFREDKSNQDPFATRNRLRNEAMPLLRDIAKRDFVPHLLRAATQQKESDATLADLLDKLDLLDPQGRLFLPKIRQLNPILQKRALFQFLKKEKTPDLSEAVVESALLLIMPKAPAALTLPGGRRLRRKEARLFIENL